MLRSLVFLLCLSSTPALACDDGHYEVCVISNWCKCVPNSGTITGSPGRVVGEVLGAADDSLEFISYLPSESARAIEQAVSNADRAVSDAAKVLFKAADEIVDAELAIGRFVERQVAAIPGFLSAAEERAREGKVADAIWHLATDQVQTTDKNAAQLAQENKHVSAAAQAAAGFYGGPAGAAAYASWKAYHDSGGKVDVALKAGALAYAMGSGYADTASLPAGTVGEIARKAAMTGAISGLSVAASGGTDEEALHAFLKSGGSVIVQSGQSYIAETAAQNTNVTTLQIEADSYCNMALGGSCSQIADWYAEAKTKMDAVHDAARAGPELVFTSDGNWVVSWVKAGVDLRNDMGVPPVVLTYVGIGSPFYENYRQIAALSGVELKKPQELQVTSRLQISARPNRKPVTVSRNLQDYLDAIARAKGVQEKNNSKLNARKFLARSFPRGVFSDIVTLVYVEPGNIPALQERQNFSIKYYNPEKNEISMSYSVRIWNESNGIFWTEGFDSDALIDLDLVYRVDTASNGFYASCNGPGPSCIKFMNVKCIGSASYCNPADWHISVTSTENPVAANNLRKFAQTIVYKIDGRPPH